MSRLPPTRVGLLAALCALLLFTAPAAAQAFKKEQYPDKGLEVQRPRRYVEIPVQPTEQWIVLRYVEEVDERAPKPSRPELALVRVDWAPDPEPEPEPAPAPPDDGGEGERTRAKPVVEVKEQGPPPPITTLERYAEQKLGGLTLGAEVKLVEPKTQGEYVLHEYRLDAKKGRQRGYVFAWRSAARTYALFGFCSEENYEDALKTWRVVAEKLVIGEPVESKET